MYKIFISKLLLVMRLTTVLLIVGMMQVSAASYGQRVTLTERKASLENIFEKIRSQSGYDFVFNRNLVLKTKPVDITLQGATIEEAMETVLKGTTLTYQIDNKTILIKPKPQSIVDKLIGYFTEMEVKGTVLDEKKSPLPGVSVKVKGSKQAAVTSGSGEFLLRGVPEKSTLVISCVGYVTKEIPAISDLGEVILVQETAKLTEVEIVSKGYYETTRELNTGSVGRVDAKTIEKQPVLNFLAAMQGRMTGVTIQQTTGVPGGDFKIEIRGRNSLRDDGNDPLYVVDGVPFSTEKVSSSNATQSILSGGASPLNGINNADIESIEVLKDADATAIYGSRGANGVILITTKKGRMGKTRVSTDIYQGAGKAPTIELLSTPAYLAMRREAFANDQLIPTSDPNDTGTGGKLYAPDLTVWSPGSDTDWQKELLGGTAMTTSAQLSVSGGSEGTQFLFSSGFRRESTVFPADYAFQRGSGHFSLNHRSADQKFTFSFTVSGTVDGNNQTSFDIANRSRAYAPNQPAMRNADGSINWAEGTTDNVYASLTRSYDGRTNTFVSNAVAGYQLLPGLTLKSTFGLSQVSSNEKSKWPSTFYKPPADQITTNSRVTDARGNTSSWIIEPQLSYERKAGPGHLSLLLGSTFQSRSFDRSAEFYQDFPSNALLDNPTIARTHFTSDLAHTDYRYAAVYGRINYNLAEKYILNFTGRRDGSSRFGPGKQFANFGAVGAAWLFGKEDWVQRNLTFLSFGKLRGSFGASGSDQIGDYQFLDTYAAPPPPANPIYDAITGLVPSRLYNPAYAWESNRKLEAALEIGLLDDRINVNAAWFRHRSSNQLIQYALPLTTGFNGILSNFPATVQNTGLELELNTVNIKNKRFSWNTTFNITVPHNKLLEFPGIESSTYANTYELGKSIYLAKVYESTGVDPQTGYFSFKDYNGDGNITSPDDNKKGVVLGQQFFGGLGNTLSYKNWSLDIFFQFVKQKGYNYWHELAYLGLGNNQPAAVFTLSRWQQPGDVAQVQRLATESNLVAQQWQRLYQQSDAAISDATFLRCKNVSFSYQMPEHWLKGLKGRIYIQGQNLFVISNYDFFDPESQALRLAPLKILTAGVQFTF